MTRRSRAFTLIEVLVALAVVAVALAAGMRALAQSADGATSLKLRTLALWVAQNRLAQAQLADPWPTPGSSNGDETQAGVQLVWRQTVSDTPNPAFRKIEIVVADPGVPDYALARLVGYLGNAHR
jgi:general secretion pathway protein I